MGNTKILFEQSGLNGPVYCAFPDASASQAVTSAGFGMRPELTTFSLMTNPGVDMML